MGVYMALFLPSALTLEQSFSLTSIQTSVENNRHLYFVFSSGALTKVFEFSKINRSQ